VSAVTVLAAAESAEAAARPLVQIGAAESRFSRRFSAELD
jgi:hypothetical protein